MSTKQKSNKNRVLLTVVAILLLTTVLGYFGYKKLHKNKPAANNTALGSDTTQNGINLEPPTAEEKASNDQHKDDLAKQNQAAPTPTDSSGKKSVTPVIVGATATLVTAYVPGIFEDGGTCTTIATNGNNKVTQTSEGFKNASYTQCAPLTFSPALSSGTWSVVVSYSSGAASGSSAATKVTGP